MFSYASMKTWQELIFCIDANRHLGFPIYMYILLVSKVILMRKHNIMSLCFQGESKHFMYTCMHKIKAQISSTTAISKAG